LFGEELIRARSFEDGWDIVPLGSVVISLFGWLHLLTPIFVFSFSVPWLSIKRFLPNEARKRLVGEVTSGQQLDVVECQSLQLAPDLLLDKARNSCFAKLAKLAPDLLLDKARNSCFAMLANQFLA